jgi:hypothetical protein
MLKNFYEIDPKVNLTENYGSKFNNSFVKLDISNNQRKLFSQYF